MKFIDEKTIQLDRELSDLDLFVADFLKILSSHTDYVLISGYVAILLGRTRTTEDVDLFIPPLSKDQFEALYQDLLHHGYWSVTVDAAEELFSMLQDKLAIRFAKKGMAVPNVEMKFIKDGLDEYTLREKIKVILGGREFFIGSLDLQIAYKKFVLQSDKDLEDARHLQQLFNLSDENINKYRPLLRRYGRL